MSGSVDYWRQQDILNRENLFKFNFTLIGAGGIGSWTALCLAKMGVDCMSIYDPDLIEIHNVPNQLYGVGSLGKNKAKELCFLLNQLAESRNGSFTEPFTKVLRENSIIISGVDSMASREEIFKAVDLNTAVRLYIDARMGAEQGRVICINPTSLEDLKFYKSTLYPDSETLPAPCTAKAIAYNVFALAAIIGSYVKRFVGDDKPPRDTWIDTASLQVLIP